MNRSFTIPSVTAIAMAALFVAPAPAQHSPRRTLHAAIDVLEANQAIHLKSIPAALLADAQGIAIIPDVVKGGFIIGGRGGHGLIFSRNADGTWAGPTFVSIGGASIGFQAGIQSTDVILVFKTRRSLERLIQGKGKVTLGADAAIAAGPIGRQMAAGTDGRLQAEIYSYSRSRGLFAGVSLDGAAIVYDSDATQAFIDSRDPQLRATAAKLVGLIAGAADPKPVALPPGTVPPPAFPGGR